MLAKDAKPWDQIFSHEYEGVLTHYNVTVLQQDMALGKVPFLAVVSPLLESMHVFLQEHFGVERPHVERLKTTHQEKLKQPMLVFVYPDGAYLLADGSHRYVAQWELGVREGKFVTVKIEDTKPYVVEDFAEHLSSEERDFLLAQGEYKGRTNGPG